MIEYDECEHPGCKKRGIRHLMSHYFCNRHRREIVIEARELDKPPEPFGEWIEEEIL